MLLHVVSFVFACFNVKKYRYGTSDGVWAYLNSVSKRQGGKDHGFEKEIFKFALRKEHCNAFNDRFAGGDDAVRRQPLQGTVEFVLYDVRRRNDLLFYTGR